MLNDDFTTEGQSSGNLVTFYPVLLSLTNISPKKRNAFNTIYFYCWFVWLRSRPDTVVFCRSKVFADNSIRLGVNLANVCPTAQATHCIFLLLFWLMETPTLSVS